MLTVWLHHHRNMASPFTIVSLQTQEIIVYYEHHHGQNGPFTLFPPWAQVKSQRATVLGKLTVSWHGSCSITQPGWPSLPACSHFRYSARPGHIGVPHWSLSFLLKLWHTLNRRRIVKVLRSTARWWRQGNCLFTPEEKITTIKKVEVDESFATLGRRYQCESVNGQDSLQEQGKSQAWLQWCTSLFPV